MPAATLDPPKKLTTRPGTEIVPGVRIFAPAVYEFANHDGSTRVETFSADDLHEMHGNFHRIYNGDGHTELKPLVTISHRPAEHFAEDDPRCHGVVGSDLHFRGDELFASLVDVPTATAGMIRRGELRNGSPEIRRKFKDQGREYGHVLMRFALLGKDQPRVKRGELPYQFADMAASAAAVHPDLPRKTYFLPLPESESVLCFSEALTMIPVVEPIPAPTPTPAPVPDLAAEIAKARDAMLSGLRQELLAFADEQKTAIARELDVAKRHAAATVQLESDRLDREKREKIKRFLDSPGLCFADDQNRVRVLPCQRAFFEDALIREDAGAVLTFADGGKDVQGTALDRRMAEIRNFPPQLHFAERMAQPIPGEQAPDPQLETRVLEATPFGRAELVRRKSGSAAPRGTATLLPPPGMSFSPMAR